MMDLGIQFSKNQEYGASKNDQQFLIIIAAVGFIPLIIKFRWYDDSAENGGTANFGTKNCSVPLSS